MSQLLNEIISKLKNMPEELLLSVKGAISGLVSSPMNTNLITACPHCGGNIIKNGTQCGRQRYLCKCCNKTFTCTVNTVQYRSRTDADIWREVISDTLEFKSLDKTVEKLGLTHDLVFHMRHKILAAMENVESDHPTKLSDVTECDETFVLESFKGTEIPNDYWRGPRKHGAKAQKRGISNEYVCICTGIGREDGVVAVSLNRAKPDAAELKAAFQGYLEEGTLVLCDGHKPYQALSIEYGCSVKDITQEEDKFFHLNNVNGLHSFIKKQYVQYRGVATKYLNRYNTLFSKVYRTGLSCLEDIYRILCMDNSQSSYFSKGTLKTLNLLNV